MAVIDEFRALVRHREVIDACERAMLIMQVMGKETPPEVFAFLDRNAQKSQFAALVCASSFFHRDMPQPGYRMKLLKRATRGNDEDVAADAYFAIAGECLSDDRTIRKAMDALERAAELGHGEAHIKLAKGYETGIFNNRVNFDKAWATLCDGVHELDYGPAKVALADFMLRYELLSDQFNPIQLLHEAVAEGVDGAEERLIALGELVDELQPRLPYLIVPKDMDRANLARNAIINELHVGDEEAAVLVARLFGFASWETMEETVESGGHGGSDFDEDCSQEDLALRKAAQIEIIEDELDVPEEFAEAVWSLLRPTARDGIPSLRALERVYKGRGGR
ncbi:hypothetical protein OIU34_23815 [Pararhizobium sp. BT-229]|uniref:hypothetical protein n=1 Tax=Pararhizobium sp. BT-229 TaxID=2986923 RepID=UPI0021F6CEEA|nr:hypothetical protein [Pararhizobium sp. BT-229]MCV9964925.1 hypothetical protein [Pararhizobium sp. BT-229]